MRIPYPAAQQRVSPRGAGVVAVPDLADQPGADAVQLAEGGVYRGHRLAGGAAGTGIRLAVITA
jgi:hypothetical protein